MTHTTPTDPSWVEPCADMERRCEQDYSRASNRIVIRRFRVTELHHEGIEND